MPYPPFKREYTLEELPLWAKVLAGKEPLDPVVAERINRVVAMYKRRSKMMRQRGNPEGLHR